MPMSSPMRHIFLFTGILLLLLLVVPAALLVLAIDREADTVVLSGRSEAASIAGIEEILINYDPRLLVNTSDQTIELSENEVNALLNYFTRQMPVNRFSGLRDSAFAVDLMPGTMTLNGSLELGGIPSGGYINFSIRGRQTGSRLQVTDIAIGDMAMPAFLYRPLFHLGRNYLKGNANYELARGLLASVNELALERDSLRIALNWQTDNLRSLGDRARQVFISPEEIDRLVRYHNRLTAIAATLPDGRRTSLNEFLGPLFEYALRDDASSPGAENRAIFLILTSYLTDMDIGILIGDGLATRLDRPRPMNVTLAGRPDLARHVVSSAAIAASAGADLANMLSIYKEVHDSRYRTGFSFSDLVANLVGTTLGKLASGNDDTAVRLQSVLSETGEETDYMPALDSYDGLTEDEFLQQYEGRDSERYRRKLRELEALVAQRPVFQTFTLAPRFE